MLVSKFIRNNVKKSLEIINDKKKFNIKYAQLYQSNKLSIKDTNKDIIQNTQNKYISILSPVLGLSTKLIYHQQYHFASVSKLKQYSLLLKQIDTLTLQRICQVFRQQYTQHQNDQQHQQSRILQQINKIYSSQISSSNSLQQSQKILQAIKYIYKSCSDSQVGFLRGDFHPQAYHKIYKFISNKLQLQQKERQKQKTKNIKSLSLIQLQSKEQEQKAQLTKQQYRNLLNFISDFRSFRLPQKGIANRNLQVKKNLYQRQLILEQVSTQQAFQKFYSVLDSLKKLQKVHLLEVVQKYAIQWFTPVCKAVKDQQLRCKMKDLSTKQTQEIGLEQSNQPIKKQQRQYAEYFVQLNPQKITSLAISELIRQIMNLMFDNNQQLNKQGLDLHQFTGINSRQLCLKISKVVNGQWIYQKQEKKFKQCQKIYDKIKADWSQRRAKKDKSQQNKSEFQNQYQQMKSLKLQYFYIKSENRKPFLKDLANKLVRASKNQIPQEVQASISLLLIYLMKQIIKVKNKYGFKVPLLVEEIKYVKDKKTKTVKSNKILKVDDYFLSNFIPQLQKQGDLNMHLDRSLPTLIQPLPWIQYQIGGYYLQSTSVMRINQCNLQSRLVKYADLSRLYSVLNYLANIPWKINKKVCAVVEAIWQQGGKSGQIPKRYSQLISTYMTKLKYEKDPKVQRQLMSKIQRLRDQHSLRSDFLLKLNIARSYSKLDKFYFPHNIDFRGRVYPIPPHLNHIGNDLSRGLLMFSTGRKLGQKGLMWLKIHCANLMGKDKAIISQKLEFIQENLQHIKMMAQQPLKYRDWLQYQDCWQSLSAITQLNDALKHPNHQQYVSFLHVHQDGSCNGLQHYAALGRDMEGAYQVNLGPTERPGDVYTHVAKMVVKFIEQDIQNPQSPQHSLATRLSQNIKRKTIKQTVMTSVYGVTFIGARQQIYKQLRNQDFMSQQQTYKASIYVARLTLKAISNLFQGAHEIKKWLLKCAKLVATTNNPIGWVTPMGLPVVQPYRTKSQVDVINTITQVLTANVNNQNLPVNKSKQQSAFPPNFVHSLDSTHMMYTAQQCRQRGLTFAAVHDSYWTHAGDVQTMNKILRQQFVRLHSQPLLQNLKQSLQRRFPEIKFPDIPKRGQFDLQKIKESIFFFS